MSQGLGMELLAPAGSVSALHAAVRAGADAVYLGLEQFNARRGADNFTYEALEEACRYAHLRGVSVFVALNTVVLPHEVDDVLECARQAYRCGADAFIVQDIGVAHELRRSLPQAELHISTQMNVHNAAGVEWAAQLGAKRVTLARELSLEEIAHLCMVATQLGLDVEVFAHGALCVCYSGQCLMSSLIGGRSANRGTCAQACRLPYELHVKGSGPVSRAPGEHLLSPKDLCTIDMLPDLAAAGVSSLKIEGRMKSPEYVFAVVSAYRSVLDRMAQSPDGMARATSEERSALAEAFSRGFTTAYLTHDRGNDIMSYQRPNNRGVFLGRITKMDTRSFVLECSEALCEGDILEVWTKKGRSTYEVSSFENKKKNVVALPFDPQDRKMRSVHVGDRVFRVRSAAAAYDDNVFEPRVPVCGKVKVRIGSPLEMSFWLGEDLRGANPDRAETFSRLVGTATGNQVEPARTKSLSLDDVISHVDRLGQSPFRLIHLDVDLDEGVGMGFSQIHQVRSAALDALSQEILSVFDAERLLPRVASRKWERGYSQGDVVVAAWATNPICARAAKKAGAQVVFVPALNYKRGTACYQGMASYETEQAGYPKQCILAIPTVEHDMIEGTREYSKDCDVWESVAEEKSVFADSSAALITALGKECGCQVGPHVPVMNRMSLDIMAKLGVERVWLSPELTLSQIKEMTGGSSPVPLGYTVIGTQELMVTEHCMLMSQGPCKENCEECNRRTREHFLKDRKGFDFPVTTDSLGRSHLYNSVATDVAHAVPDLLTAGVTAFMVDTTLMTAEQTAQAVGRVVRACDLAQRGDGSVSKVAKATSGHLFRGIS